MLGYRGSVAETISAMVGVVVVVAVFVGAIEYFDSGTGTNGLMASVSALPSAPHVGNGDR